MSIPLAGRVVLVTGASSGIGEATARLLARRGCDLVLASRRGEQLEALAKELVEANGNIRVVPLTLDVTRYDQAEAVVRSALERLGRIDVLFNNAGLGSLDRLVDLDPELDIRHQIDVNLVGPAFMARAVLPHMCARRQGHIINMGSMGGLIGTPTYSVYAATKFGVRGFSEALRRELFHSGVKVSTIYPGPVRTPFIDNAPKRRVRRSLAPEFFILEPEQVAAGVARLIQRPRRRMVLPWILLPAAWINDLFPAVLDSLVALYYGEETRA